MLINLLVWIIIGGLAGWVASIIMKTDSQQGPIGNIVVGILGALIGGFIMGQFGGGGFDGFNLGSFLVALLGSVVLLFILKLIRRS